MKILVIGAGMYVTGRGTAGIGTILPALAQYSRDNLVECVTVAATRPESASGVIESCRRINDLLGSHLRAEYRQIQSAADLTIRPSEFDCAIVCVPDHLHFEATAELLRAGVHCLVVKPLTPTLAEATKLLALQEEHGLLGVVEFHKRFDEQNLLVRKMIRDGAIGTPRYMVVAYSQRIGIPLDVFRAWSHRTNIFQYLGVHYVDLIYFLTGFRPVRASAVGSRGVLEANGVDTFDSVHATIVWEDAAKQGEFVSQLAIGWIDPNSTSALSDQRYFLVGSSGRVDLDQTDRGIHLVSGPSGMETPNPHFSMILGEGEGVAFQGYGYRSIERFLKDVARVKAGQISPSSLEGVRPSFRQSLVSTSVVEAVNESLGAGGAWRKTNAPA